LLSCSVFLTSSADVAIVDGTRSTAAAHRRGPFVCKRPVADRQDLFDRTNLV